VPIQLAGDRLNGRNLAGLGVTLLCLPALLRVLEPYLNVSAFDDLARLHRRSDRMVY
jgi:hypothetical protein